MIYDNIVTGNVDDCDDSPSGSDSYTVEIVRPIGSLHPDYPSIVYSLNYGYVEGVTTDTGEHQGAFVVGLDTPAERFTGKKIAVIHRSDPNEEKWVIAPDNMPYNKQQIEEMVYFLSSILTARLRCLMKKCGMHMTGMRSFWDIRFQEVWQNLFQKGFTI